MDMEEKSSLSLSLSFSLYVLMNERKSFRRCSSSLFLLLLGVCGLPPCAVWVCCDLCVRRKIRDACACPNLGEMEGGREI